MASNTTNYNLVKPAYADDADIADINGNMDIIDGAMKDLADNVADTYNPASTYAVGDRCTYGGGLYKCTTAISTAEAWNSAHWTACTVDEVMASNSGAIDTLQEEIGIVINGNTAAVNVVKGQYVIVKNSTIVGITDGLYTYNDSTTKTAGNTFISSELDAVPNGGLNALNSKIPVLFYSDIEMGKTGLTSESTVSFSRQHTTAPNYIFITCQAQESNQDRYGTTNNLTKTGFHVRVTNGGSTSSGYVHWMAIWT